ncbi:AAA family ATPase [Aquimarina brevivitae]|uniref:NadR type nicotinamide-nucleotide adenylyltransferase n=1 Tax=Aquimarina brevivitae TaxID=323412 RepID=A0A4Q7PGT8_9FLAO|nr:ATP-binding protein [Aquimarina brevivitae]RZS99595.1 NadR type nicotinamide-nucleotide adenylyltransferase [Aquimarina brevivitae]
MEKTLKQTDSDCLKVVLFGPESTGKSTLAAELAVYYNTIWVKEYMRDYLQHKWNVEKAKCTYDDLLPIAEGQMQAENQSVAVANDILICDTNLLELKVYAQVYYNGKVPDAIRKFALQNKYDLYLLTDVDVPWVADDLRDKPQERQEMFEEFRNELETQNLPYVLINGDRVTRLNRAIKAIHKLIKAYNSENNRQGH